jgi:hypothetical protein
VNDTVGDDNIVDMQFSMELQVIVQSTKLTRERQLPIRYR